MWFIIIIITFGKYCILGEHEFSREHHQQVYTYNMYTNCRVRNRVGTSPVRVTTQLILISHVGLMIHWYVIKNYVFLQKCKVNRENTGNANVFNDDQMDTDDV